MMHRYFLLFPAAALAACAAPSPDAARLLDGLGTHSRPIATSSSEAQRWFDQGLALCYAFNHDEAARSFRAAARLDPDCAMAYWGEAYALGPNINLPMTDPEVAKAAHAAAQRALMLRERESPANRALIDAMAKRYVAEPPEDRASLDAAWADAMRDAYRRFPRDADIGALFAEALLDQHPWWTWTKDGQPMYGTEEAILALEATLEHAPLHPQANHLYIHAVEASPRPERGIPSAERLGELLPAAGHLVHMPAHIWINLGRYEAAENANHRAVAADRAYLRRSGPQGIYEFYRAHNHHFLVYAAMFAGRRELALRAARNLVAEIPDAMKRDMPGLVDGFLAVPLHALLRFGRYDDVLREPQFGEAFPIARALWHYARGIAFAAKGRIAEAGAEQRAFTAAAELVTEDAAIGINAARPVIEVARAMLEGELLYRKGRTDDGFAALRRAVELEDALRYDEPSPWMQPVRHALGALLHEQGRHAEAAEVFRQDLRIHRENGWALHGLAACLRASGEAVAARGVEARLAQAWARADTKIAAACYCSRAAGASAPLDADGKSTGGACR